MISLRIDQIESKYLLTVPEISTPEQTETPLNKLSMNWLNLVRKKMDLVTSL